MAAPPTRQNLPVFTGLSLWPKCCKVSVRIPFTYGLQVKEKKEDQKRVGKGSDVRKVISPEFKKGEEGTGWKKQKDGKQL